MKLQTFCAGCGASYRSEDREVRATRRDEGAVHSTYCVLCGESALEFRPLEGKEPVGVQ